MNIMNLQSSWSAPTLRPFSGNLRFFCTPWFLMESDRPSVRFIRPGLWARIGRNGFIFPMKKTTCWLKFSAGFSTQTAMLCGKDPCVFAPLQQTRVDALTPRSAPDADQEAQELHHAPGHTDTRGHLIYLSCGTLEKSSWRTFSWARKTQHGFKTTSTAKKNKKKTVVLQHKHLKNWRRTFIRNWSKEKYLNNMFMFEAQTPSLLQ